MTAESTNARHGNSLPLAERESFSEAFARLTHGSGDFSPPEISDWGQLHENFALTDSGLALQVGPEVIQEPPAQHVPSHESAAEPPAEAEAESPETTAEDDRLIRIERFETWSEPIRHLAAVWQPILIDLVHGRITEKQAEDAMASALESYLFSRRRLSADRVATLAKCIRKILGLRKSTAALLADNQQTVPETLRMLRNLCRDSAAARSSIGLYGAFANLVHNAFIDYYRKAGGAHSGN